jgi:hypothetical protein
MSAIRPGSRSEHGGGLREAGAKHKSVFVDELPARRGCTIVPGIRLHTLAEVTEHLGAGGGTGIIDGTEIRVRRTTASAFSPSQGLISGSRHEAPHSSA